MPDDTGIPDQAHEVPPGESVQLSPSVIALGEPDVGLDKVAAIAPEAQTSRHAAAPIVIVETCGVKKRGCTRPKASGIAPCRAIDSVVRDAGRIVVCVEDRADVMIASTTSLSSGYPSTSVARAPKIPASSSNSATRSRPAYDTTAIVVTT